ncbi:MAG: polysaccharide biosynthesis tyrosine autokinase [Armatimonadetes bacterium]|nr:polysaccharide biosynthesis tyrosine autokinase [Armatimonadota bacterium]
MSFEHGSELGSPGLSLKEYLQVVQRRWPTVAVATVLGAAVGIAAGLASVPSFRASGTMMVPVVPLTSNVSVLDGGNPLGAVLAGGAPESFPTQIELLQSEGFLKEARERAAIQQDAPGVSVEGEETTATITVSAEGPRPKLCANMVNAIMSLHQERMRRQQTDAITRTIAFVQRQIGEAERKLQESDRKLLIFRRTHRIDEAISARESQARELVTLRSRARELVSTVGALAGQAAAARQQLVHEPPQIKQIITSPNPQFQVLQVRLSELKRERAELLAEFRESSVEVQTLEEKIREVSAQSAATPAEIQQETHVPNPKRPSLEAQLAQAEAALKGNEQELRSLTARIVEESSTRVEDGQLEVTLARMTVERDAVQDEWKTLMNRLRDLQLRAQVPPLETRILSRAEIPTTPVTTRRSSQVMIFALGAALLGVLVMALQEWVDDRIQSTEHVERFAGLASLGQIPVLDPTQRSELATLGEGAMVSEPYRSLRAGVGFSSLDQPIRRLLITSPHQGDGKTLTALNLAAAFALDGKRVILVDADLRRPMLHRLMNLPHESGLSMLLSGQAALEACLCPTGIPTLRVLPAGVLPPNPAELLGSMAMEDVLADLEDRADLVIVDSPPCLPVTDPLILASRVDGVLLVLTAGRTRRGPLRHAYRLLERARGRVIGVVLNRQRREAPEREGYEGYGEYGETSQPSRGRRGPTGILAGAAFGRGRSEE